MADPRPGGDGHAPFLEGIVGSSLVLVFRVHPSSLALDYVSPNIATVLGYAPREILGVPNWWLERLHPDEREEVAEILTRGLAERAETGEHEFRFLHRNGSYRWFHASVRMHYDDSGAPQALIGCAVDITGRKLAEAQAQEAEAWYRALVEQLPAITYVNAAEEATPTLFISPQVQQLLGLNAQAWVEDPSLWYSLLRPDHRERVQAEWVRCRDTGQPFEAEYPIVAPDGREVWFHDRAAVLPDADGLPAFIHGLMVDITERKSAERALRESECRYGALVETSPDAIVITGLDTRILLCNRQAAELHGYRDPAELIGKDALDLIAPEDRARAAENARTTLETGGVRDIEYTLLRADGTRFPAELSASVISDPAGEPGAFLGVVRDITARKQAEQQLREAEGKYRTLVEQLPAVVYLAGFGGTGEWRYVSPQLETVLGYTPEEWLAHPHPLATYMHPEDRERFLGEEARSEATGEPFRCDYRLYASDGRVVWLRDEAVAVSADSGGPRFWQGVMLDITEQKQAEEALRASEDRLGTVVTSAPVVLFALDGDGVFVLSEGKGLEALGLRPGEVVGRSVFEVYADFPSVLEHVHRAMTGQGFTAVVEVGPLAFQTHYVPQLDAAGRVVGLVGVATDITERNRAEEELRHTIEALREVDVARRDLLARLVDAREEEHQRIAADVHDGPVQKMVAVGLRLEMLRRQIRDPEQLETLDDLARTVDAATRELRHMLFELVPPTLETEGLAAALRTSLRNLAEETGTNVRVESLLATEPENPARTICFRIAQEAIMNARKHAEANEVVITLDTVDEGVLVSVRDDGRGFDPQDLQEPGHLGLSEMRSRAESAGGWWCVDTGPGEGTTVKFWVPHMPTIECRGGSPAPT